MMHDFGRIEHFYLETLQMLKSGKPISLIKKEAQNFVADHDYDAATGLLKAISEFTGIL